jgi:hypothetical protein
VPIQAVLTLGGVGGVALGIGARAATSNALAGFAMMLTHTMHEGDAVELVGRGISGVVVDISLTTTTLLTPDATCVAACGMHHGLTASRCVVLTCIGRAFDAQDGFPAKC